MTFEEPRYASSSGIGGRGHPQRRSGPRDVLVVVGVWTATVLVYVAQPVVALLWAGAAITGAVALLAHGRPLRTPAIAALVFAGVGLLWMLVQLGTLY
jgi:hypothetical protein